MVSQLIELFCIDPSNQNCVLSLTLTLLQLKEKKDVSLIHNRAEISKEINLTVISFSIACVA